MVALYLPDIHTTRARLAVHRYPALRFQAQVHLEALCETELSRWDAMQGQDIIRVEFAKTRRRALGFTRPTEWAALSATEETINGV